MLTHAVLHLAAASKPAGVLSLPWLQLEFGFQIRQWVWVALHLVLVLFSRCAERSPSAEGAVWAMAVLASEVSKPAVIKRRCAMFIRVPWSTPETHAFRLEPMVGKPCQAFMNNCAACVKLLPHSKPLGLSWPPLPINRHRVTR